MNSYRQGRNKNEGTIKRIRHAVRAIILDGQESMLLCRFRPPHPAVPSDSTGVWAAPGGGVEPGESPLEALRRELLEETGLTVQVDPPHVWRQEIAVAEHGDGRGGMINDYFLVRAARFEPHGILSDDEITAEGIDRFRWWALPDIAGYSGPDLFSPRDLARPLKDLISRAVPPTPIPLGL